jgi:hypothetical protein
MGRSRTRHRQIVDDLKEVTGYWNWKRKH